MTELINSLKTLAYGGGGSHSIADRRSSTGQLRIIPLLNLGRNDSSNDSSFTQWRDAMRMVARLPGGLPPEFRLRLWENLSDRYMQDHGISWSRVMVRCRVTNSRDEEIADQIEKDLHRTGCTGFEGGKQAVLKRVLVAYARWNPSVGYCQGFNMIGAMLLQMTSGNETLTLKVLIFLIEGVLPQGYFSQGLRGLAVDMAVFREILRLRKPTLHNHLSILQNGDENPPLTDVFTMHWFLTLFIHCLPTNSVLRIWDLVLLEGSEVLIRTALVLWTAIEPRILAVSSADEFYSVMGVVTREMLEFGLMDPNALVKCTVSVGPFPFPGLVELRQQQRALIQQDTPYKSFFLAKRELDNLKRHYAAMKDRQKATTIILRGLEASRVRVPGQRSNSLFVAPTMKKQMVNSTKPKTRRASSASKGSNNNNNASNINNGNLNNRSNNMRNNLNNGNQLKAGAAAGGAGGGGGVLAKSSSKQVTMTWDKAAPKIRSKAFRRRRTASASSHTTDSSSSTELCDSNSSLSDSSDSEGVWSEADNQWKKPKSKKKSNSPGSVSLKSNKSNLSLCPPPKDGEPDLMSQIDKPEEQQTSVPGESRVDGENDKSLPPLRHGSEEKSPSQEDDEDDQHSPEEGTDIVQGVGGGGQNGTKILDANDSQHFLEEISRLGKSDSFYENLSKRICELQFQNLRILNSCNTTIDPKSLILPEFDKSPLPSPMNPYSPSAKAFLENGGHHQDDIFLADSSLKLTPIHTPKKHLSPRGSSSSISSELPKSPVSPTATVFTPTADMPKSRRSSYSNSKRTASGGNKSSQSISSVDIPNICVDSPTADGRDKIPTENGHHHRCPHPQHQSSEEIADSVSHFMMTLKKTSNPASADYTTEFESEFSETNDIILEDETEQHEAELLQARNGKCQSSPGRKNSSGLTLDLSSLAATTSPIKPFTPLKTPDFLQLGSFLTKSTEEISTSTTHGSCSEMTPLSSQDKVDSSELEDFGSHYPSTASPRKLSSSVQSDMRNCLVSPIISADLTETSPGKTKSKCPMSPPKDIAIPPRPKNFPVSPAEPEEFLFAAYNTKENGFDVGVEDGVDDDDDGNDEIIAKDCYRVEDVDDDDDDDVVVVDDACTSPVFPTTACPCQCQTTEEINAVIRQNIAILQRLKLKPAYELALAEGGDLALDEEYEDLEFDEEGSSSDYSTGFPELSNFKEDDSSDRDSGLPTCSSKNSLSRKDSCGGTSGTGSKVSLKHQDSSGCSSGSSNATSQQIGDTVVTTTSTAPARRRSCSGGNAVGGNSKPVRRKSLTRTSSNNTSSSGQTSSSGSGKQKKNFNPFPTARRSRVRTTKFGLYN